jgi:hypothetical protein
VWAVAGNSNLWCCWGWQQVPMQPASTAHVGMEFAASPLHRGMLLCALYGRYTQLICGMHAQPFTGSCIGIIKAAHFTARGVA